MTHHLDLCLFYIFGNREMYFTRTDSFLISIVDPIKPGSIPPLYEKNNYTNTWL